MHRRDFMVGGLGLAAMAATGGAAGTPAGVESVPFDGTTVRRLAQQLARTAYRAPGESLPPQLKKLAYDEYRAIRFRPESALWRDLDLPFQLQFFHRGFLFADRVELHEVHEGRARELRYSPDQFTFGPTLALPSDPALGYAGFRVHGKLNRADYFDEIAVFLGASYFRAVAKGQVFGLSARGLSIKTGDPKGEEFPAFRSFWIERPAPRTQSLVVHALLDSPSTAAAYRFTIRPGDSTVTDVELVLYPRVEISQPGLGTLTSMFYFDAHHRAGIDDFRPAVHDSAGLAIQTGHGERLWRPLVNPRDLRVSGFEEANLRGFGLMQRQRDFASFEDLEARYERRPSAWVEPIGDWGTGQVFLYEIPSRNEYNDNIVSFWRPKDLLQPQREYIYTYRVHWSDTNPHPTEHATFQRTRQGTAPSGSRRLFVLDAVGDVLAKLPAGAQVRGEVSASDGSIQNVVTQPNPHSKGWRLSFELDPAKANTVELRARLLRENETLSETWIYRWSR
jgi:glucans biosynthesis protein